MSRVSFKSSSLFFVCFLLAIGLRNGQHFEIHAEVSVLPMTANSAVLILFFLDLSRVLRVQVYILRLTPSESQVTIGLKFL